MNQTDLIAIKRALVKIWFKSGEDYFFKGTGFFIHSDGYLLTAYHCVKDCKNNIMVESLSVGKKCARYLPEYSLPGADIAVLQLADPSMENTVPHYLPLGTIPDNGQNIEQNNAVKAVVVIGYPQPNESQMVAEPATYHGHINRSFKNNENFVLECEAIVGKGQSGSPVYHPATRRVVAVAHSMYEGMRSGDAVRFEPLFQSHPKLKFLNQKSELVWEQQLITTDQEILQQHQEELQRLRLQREREEGKLAQQRAEIEWKQQEEASRLKQLQEQREIEKRESEQKLEQQQEELQRLQLQWEREERELVQQRAEIEQKQREPLSKKHVSSKKKPMGLWNLLGVSFIIGLLSAIVIPAYSDYLKRAQVTEALQWMGGLTSPTEEFVGRNHLWPYLTSLGAKTGGRNFTELTSIGSGMEFRPGIKFGFKVKMSKFGANSWVALQCFPIEEIVNGQKVMKGCSWKCNKTTSSDLANGHLPSSCEDADVTLP